MKRTTAASDRDAVLRARIAQVALAVEGANALAWVVLLRSASTLDLVVQWQWLGGGLRLLRVFTAIAFLMWLYRASRRAHALASRPLRYGPAAAVGWWLVPLANFWMPFRVVSEIDQASDPREPARTSMLVATWWAAWVGGAVLRWPLELALHQSTGFLVQTLVDLLNAAAAVLAIAVIERIRRNQQALADHDPRAIAETFV